MVLLTFILLFLTWILLSGRFDTLHLTLGVLSCALVAVICTEILFKKPRKALRNRWAEAWRFLAYAVWLTVEVVHANFSVLVLAFHPRMKQRIDPGVIVFKSDLEDKFAQVVLANSITLTPGTVTVRLRDDIFTIHAINQQGARQSVLEMQARVKRVFEPHKDW